MYQIVQDRLCWLLVSGTLFLPAALLSMSNCMLRRSWSFMFLVWREKKNAFAKSKSILLRCYSRSGLDTLDSRWRGAQVKEDRPREGDKRTNWTAWFISSDLQSRCRWCVHAALSGWGLERNKVQPHSVRDSRRKAGSDTTRYSLRSDKILTLHLQARKKNNDTPTDMRNQTVIRNWAFEIRPGRQLNKLTSTQLVSQ